MFVSQILSLEERVARIEGILGQMDKRLDNIDRRLHGINRRLDSRFNSLLGIMITMWVSQVSLLVAILLKA